jgi:hypothetical protein
LAISFYTVDVGHGLCQVIAFGGRRAILIDGGGKIGKPVAEEFLKRYFDVIVAYVATHNDCDHVGAAPDLLDAYSTSALLQHIWLLFDRPASRLEQRDHDVIPLLGYARRRQDSGTIRGTHALYLDDAITSSVRVKVIHREPAENAELQLLYPKCIDATDSFLRGRPDSEATNQSSAILRLVVGKRDATASVLITGDANCHSFKVAREVYRLDLRARVLSVPHHGGRIPDSSGDALWDDVVGWVSPEIAVVSAGYSNVPSPTTTRRTSFDPLRKRGIKMCCTQITRHCHPDFEQLHPGVVEFQACAYPQMSGRKEYPNAIGCYGTIAVKVDAVGNVEVANYDSYRQRVISKVASASTPHCV